MRPRLRVKLGRLELKNPLVTASGTFGFGREYAGLVDLRRLGAVTVKSLTLRPRAGNPPPRIAETPAGMLNAIGLENPGVEWFLAEGLPFLRERGVPVIASIAGETPEEYAALAAVLDRAPGLAALEVNLSCPNVARGGLAFGGDPAAAAEVTRAVRKATGLPVIAKLSALVTDLVAVARAALEAGADVLSLINTLPGMAVDVDRRRPVLGNVFGGLSGPAIRPVAVRAVWQVYAALRCPIIGMGGIVTARDALEFALAGARAVAVGTAHFVNPRAAEEVLDGIERYLAERGVADFNELVGAAHGGG
jgi:dihydroorotate dehydrogenase (NAD+) catalytic subunit